MFTRYYEIKTHEQTHDGFVMHPVEIAYTEKQLNKKISTIFTKCVKAEKDGHKLYAMDIWSHAEVNLFGLFTIKEAHEKIFHWDCYKK